MIRRTVPPCILLRLFRWYCQPELRDSIEGDLIELYQERLHTIGKTRASIRLALDVILLFRPGIIRSFGQQTTTTNPLAMFSNYFKIGWRSLVKQKSYSIINVGGLALGIGVSMIIGLWVYDELTFNSYHKNYDKIAKVYRHNTFTSGTETNLFSVAGLGTLLKSEYDQYFENVVMMRASRDTRILQKGEKWFGEYGYSMQADGPEMLSLKMRQGTIRGLDDNSSIMLSETVADKLFPDEDPINQIVRVDSKWDLKVTGVYEDLPQNSEFVNAKYIVPLELYLGPTGLNIWDNYNIFIYVQLKPGLDFTNVSLAIKDAMLPHVDERTAASNPELFLLPMKDWHLNSYFENGVQTTSPRMNAVTYFSIIGVFVLLLACINFVNLNTARSERRAKEVGIRKSVGSVRQQLVNQFLIESVLVVALAFILAIPLIQLTLPSFNNLTDKSLALPFTHWQFWLGGLGFVLFIGVVAGSYPALYLSSFNATQVLKGTFRVGAYSSLPRQIMVIVQFAVSVMLITGTFIIYRQIEFGRNRSLGYDKNGLVAIRLGAQENRGDTEVLRSQLISTGVVRDIAESNYPITSTLGWNDNFQWKTKTDDIEGLSFNTVFVTHSYGNTMGLEFVSGRDFTDDIQSDLEGVIINETAANDLGGEDLIGETLIWDHWGQRMEYTILGIFKDMVKGSPFAKTDPIMLFMSARPLEFLYVRLNDDVDPRSALPKVEKAFKAVVPEVPFDYSFADQDYDFKFKEEERIGKLAAVFSSFAIFISCLGVLGLVSYVAEKRSKEISIRKVLGATTSQVWQMISKDFLLLVLISCGVALPLSYILMNQWLERYYYRTDIPWYLLIGSGICILIVTLITVSFQSIKAGTANPVDNLRSE